MKNRFVIATGLLPALLALAQTPRDPSARPEFEVASVKPNDSGSVQGIERSTPGRFDMENETLKLFIRFAWGVKNFQIKGGPSWINSDRYDIAAIAGNDAAIPQMWPMLQALLEDRFKLAMHHETRELPVYALVAAKGGLKLSESKEGSCIPMTPGTPIPPPPQLAIGQPRSCGNIGMSMRQMDGFRVSMGALARMLSELTGHIVVDQTGFKGTFDVHLEWTPDQSTPGPNGLGPPPGYGCLRALDLHSPAGTARPQTRIPEGPRGNSGDRPRRKAHGKLISQGTIWTSHASDHHATTNTAHDLASYRDTRSTRARPCARV